MGEEKAAQFWKENSEKFETIMETADGKLYVTFIITSNYYEHIRVECDSNGYYIPGGNIIFPPSWDTEERREHAVLKSRRFYTNRPSEQ